MIGEIPGSGLSGRRFGSCRVFGMANRTSGRRSRAYRATCALAASARHPEMQE